MKDILDNAVTRNDQYLKETKEITNLIKNNSTINGIKYVEYSYTKSNTNYKEYLTSDGGAYTLRFIIVSKETNINDIINDFSNYIIIKSNH